MTLFFNYTNPYQMIALLGTFSAVIILVNASFFINIRKRENFYLLLFLLSLGANNLSNYMLDIGLHRTFPIIPLLPISLTLLIPVSSYFYLSALTDRPVETSTYGKILVSLVLIELLFYILLISCYIVAPQLIPGNTSFVTKLFQLKEFVSIFLTILLSADIILKFYIEPTKKTVRNIKWAKMFFGITSSIVLCWIAAYIYGFFAEDFSRSVYYPIWCLSTFVICFCGPFGFRREETGVQPSSAGNIVDEKNLQKSQLLILEELMSSKKLYKESKLSLKGLAIHSGISATRITKLLKENNENFSSFVNRYRVEEAKRLLLEHDSFKYTMDFICEEAGFNSRASFFNIFKTVTGKTPKQYRSQMEFMAKSQESRISPKEENFV